MDKSPDAFRTISEAAELLDLPQHVLRFWETRFTQIKPLKRGGGRRYYRPDDINLLKGIRYLLYDQGFTIKGVQRILKEQGAKHVVEIGETGQLPNNFSYANSDDDEDSHESLAAQSLAPSISNRDLDALKSVMENLETALQLIKSVKKAKTE